jgi:hypothetical protein
VELSRRTHRSRTAGGSRSRRTVRAWSRALVTRTLCPWASNAETRLAMVCVLPVPGGPCTTTPVSCSRRRSTLRWRSLVLPGKSGSPPSRGGISRLSQFARASVSRGSTSCASASGACASEATLSAIRS